MIENILQVFGSPCSTTKAFSAHRPMKIVLSKSSDLSPLFLCNQKVTYTEKLKMLKKNPVFMQEFNLVF